ncbi:DUF6221 family protein [Nocardiopsis lucentensis]|uniref:DUF6221 family protein n=1 Tax=Nocardiopsis lucentensis TaxID=53441 RepID=UPI00034953F6|nr:DUF6221 family protein [Nocardiopsis lucentensis]
MTIAEFLTARLDEEQRIAQEATEYTDLVYGDEGPMKTLDPGAFGMQYNPDIPGLIVDGRRVLREVKAKRAILAEHSEEGRGDHRGCNGCGWCPGDEVRRNDIDECPTLRALASVYADHPDYDQTWAL